MSNIKVNNIKTLDDNHPWYNLRLDLDINVVLDEYKPQMISRPTIKTDNYSEFDIDITKKKTKKKKKKNLCGRNNCVIS